MFEEGKQETYTLNRTIDKITSGISAINSLACTGKGIFEIIKYSRPEMYPQSIINGNMDHAFQGVIIGLLSGMVSYHLYKSAKGE
jgi:hypothetical protein